MRCCSGSGSTPEADEDLPEKARAMKTMTCEQLGGPCQVPHHGQTADEVIKAQDEHLKDVVAEGDTTHESALKEMKGRWKHPISGMGWYRKAKRDFAALPED
jgi:predicted small metal-binding protein